MTINNCEFCKKPPATGSFGKLFDIWCSSPDHKCFPGAWVSASSKEEAVEEWNKLYGVKPKKKEE